MNYFTHFRSQVLFLIILLTIFSGTNTLYAQFDSVYWSFGTSGTAIANASVSTHVKVPAMGCVADTGNACCAFGSASGYSTLYFTNQFPSSGYPAASGEPTMRNNAKTGALNPATSTYFSFSVTPVAGSSVEIKEIHFAGLKNVTGPASYTIRTSVDGYTANVGTGSFSTSYGTSKKSHTGLSIPGTTGVPLIVRIYTHNALVTGNGGNTFIDDVTIYYTVTTVIPPGINTGAIATGTLCAGTVVNVPYTTIGIFTTGNLFTAQLSDAGGSFTSPVNIGTLNGTASGTINATIPIGTPAGIGYRIRVISSTPAVIAADNGVNLNIGATITPSVSILANPGTTICAGSPAMFSATPVSGGLNPMYQWKKNGTINVGTNSPSYTDNTLVNGDVITLEMTSNETCATPATVTSNSLAMTVNVPVTPTVTIASNTTGAICAGTAVTFTATPTNEGATPVYQWKKNGFNTGNNSAVYTDNILVNGDVITAELTSSDACAVPSTVTGNAVAMVVNPVQVPSVNITVTPSATVCDGTPVTFSASPVNGGSAPQYQWKVNGNNSGNSSTLTSSILTDGDIVMVELTSNATCATPLVASSGAIQMKIEPTTPPTALLTVQPADSVVLGQTATFTLYIADGGINPVIQWMKNGNTIAGVTGTVYVTDSIAQNDTISCIVQSSNICANPNITSSNAYTMKIIGAMGINDRSFNYESNISLYPNPNTGSFTIESTIATAKTVYAKVLNTLGQVVYETEFPVVNDKLNRRITLGPISSGIYFMYLQTENYNTKPIRFTIQ